MNKILLSIFILSCLCITGCSRQPPSKDYIICGLYGTCPEGYNTSFIGGECRRCFIPSMINYSFDFVSHVNPSDNITQAFNRGMVSAVSQIIDNTHDCQIAVLVLILVMIVLSVN